MSRVVFVPGAGGEGYLGYSRGYEPWMSQVLCHYRGDGAAPALRLAGGA